MPAGSFEGRTAIVTGAASGLGRALALALSEQGAALWLIDLDTPGLEVTAGLIHEGGGRVHIETVNVADVRTLTRTPAGVRAGTGAGRRPGPSGRVGDQASVPMLCPR